MHVNSLILSSRFSLTVLFEAHWLYYCMSISYRLHTNDQRHTLAQQYIRYVYFFGIFVFYAILFVIYFCAVSGTDDDCQHAKSQET